MRVSWSPGLIDSKSTHFFLACPVFSSTSCVDAMYCRMDRPLVVDDDSVWSPVRMVSYSFVGAFVSRVYRFVFAEVPDMGQIGIKDDLYGVSRTEKYSDPPGVL